jgi:hypothetical protein
VEASYEGTAVNAISEPAWRMKFLLLAL